MIEPMESALKQAGLTASEIKVYLSLLKNGPQTKTPLVKSAKLSGSKVYEITDKLIEKGLVVLSQKRSAKLFHAVGPEKILNFLDNKKKSIEEAKSGIEQVIPLLNKFCKQNYAEPEIKIYFGWEGFASAYDEELNKANPGSEVLIFGASTGANEPRTERFFVKYGRIAKEKKLRIKVIFNKTARNYVKRIESNLGNIYEKKFLFKKTPAEITIFNGSILITLLKEEPTIIKIRDAQTVESFKEYFRQLWDVAK